jgi:translation initiation factor 1
MDWKSSLEALKSTLPEGENTTAADTSAEPVETSATPSAKQPRLDVLLDRKGRKGKDATLIVGFTLGDDEVAAIATKLKQKLGVGGSSRGGEILIQGDKRQQVLAALTTMGFKARII